MQKYSTEDQKLISENFEKSMLMDEQIEGADMDEEIEELLLRNTMAIDEMKATLKDLN